MSNVPGSNRPGKVGVYERPKGKGGTKLILFGILLLVIAAVLWFLFFNNR